MIIMNMYIITTYHTRLPRIKAVNAILDITNN